MTNPPHPIVQISLDFTTVETAPDHVRKVVRAGVEWLEAGTPMLGEGVHAVKAFRPEIPDHPVVVDSKCMDGDYLEPERCSRPTPRMRW